MIKLKFRLCRSASCVEVVAIGVTGLYSADPEIAVPYSIARKLFENEIKASLVEKKLFGKSFIFPKSLEMINTFVVAEDRISGPVQAYLYIVDDETSYVSEKLLSMHRIVIIDPWEGLWCFRDELGERIRRSV